MNEKNLVICDPEIRYANRLGENISQREELAVKVHICSSFEKLKELCKDVGTDWVELVTFDGIHEFCKDDTPVEKLVNELLSE